MDGKIPNKKLTSNKTREKNTEWADWLIDLGELRKTDLAGWRSNDNDLARNKGKPGEYILREVMTNKKQAKQSVTENQVWKRKLTYQQN